MVVAGEDEGFVLVHALSKGGQPAYIVGYKKWFLVMFFILGSMMVVSVLDSGGLTTVND